jgi:RNA polymerase subunit RPABC4/transcription elongation factor Spt4
MICPKCGIMASEGRQICLNCGAYLTMATPHIQKDDFNHDEAPKYFHYVPKQYRQPDYIVPLNLLILFYVCIIVAIFGFIVNMFLLYNPPTDVYGNADYSPIIMGFLFSILLLGMSIRLYGNITMIRETGFRQCNRCHASVNPKLDFCPNCDKKFSITDYF